MNKLRFYKYHLYGLIFVLILVGISLFLYRHFILQVPLTNNQVVNSWMVEANLHFVAEKSSPVKIGFTIPYFSPNIAILDEYFISAQNYGVTTNLEDYNRKVVWSLRRGKGQQSLYYRAILRQTENDFILKAPPAVKISVLDENQQAAISAIIQQVRSSSADIQTFAQETLKEINSRTNNAKLLVNGDFNEISIIQSAVKVLQQARIYGMLIQGLQLSPQHKANFKALLAVYNGKKWIFINPSNNSAGLPNDFLIWHYGDSPIYEVAGGKKLSFKLSVALTPVNALTIAKSRGIQNNSKLIRFSLLQLPVTLQETYKILLMIPIGAFLILLLRNFIGLTTFGTFMPVLIALAFRETQLIWGVFLFTMVVVCGLIIRFYLEQLRLLLVSRLTAILTIVIMLMLFVSIISQHLGLTAGLSIALFPMVILTMTIERVCILWDERGGSAAILTSLGSLLAASFAFMAMNYTPLQYLFFAFPELLLILLALILWTGQYRGYRLYELFRFRSLVKQC